MFPLRDSKSIYYIPELSICFLVVVFTMKYTRISEDVVGRCVFGAVFVYSCFTCLLKFSFNTWFGRCACSVRAMRIERLHSVGLEFMDSTGNDRCGGDGGT